MKRKILGLAALLMVLVLILSSCGAKDAAASKKDASPTAVVTEAAAATAAPGAETQEGSEESGPIIEPQAIADYLFEHGELPENFITKKEAKELGWDSRYNYVSDVAPGMSIGGKYYECDCYYTGGERSAYRIIYSNDGHVWYTEDHYNTFVEMKPSH